MNRKDFIEKIAPIIQREAKKRGYKYPSAIIAQACIESANGNSELSSKYYNYFGLKCGVAWKGKSINFHTKEVLNGATVDIRDNFRVFDSMEKGVEGYFDFISTPRYECLKNATSSRHYLELIKASGYATATNYAQVVYNVVENDRLTTWDNFEAEKKPRKKKETVSKEKTVKTLAKEVISGKWGNGEERRERLTLAGYDYNAVQAEVNKMLM